MSYRLIVDENLDPATAEPLRARGHDATTIAEEFGKGEKDPNIIGYARETRDFSHERYRLSRPHCHR